MMARSWLFVPGGDSRKLARAQTTKADAVIIDLEDAVSRENKEAARSIVSSWFQTSQFNFQVWIRVNNDPELIQKDLHLISSELVVGLVIPKVDNAAQLTDLIALVDQMEDQIGRPRLSLGVIPMVETAAAVFEARTLADLPRVQTLMLGEYDLAADINVEHSDSNPVLDRCRSEMVLACAGASRRPPVAPVSRNVRDLQAFRSSTERFRNMGHLGRATIHPAQVSVVNEVFTPSQEALSSARRVLALYEESLERGISVLLDDDGQMIDEAIARQARVTLELGKSEIATTTPHEETAR